MRSGSLRKKNGTGKPESLTWPKSQRTSIFLLRAGRGVHGTLSRKRKVSTHVKGPLSSTAPREFGRLGGLAGNPETRTTVPGPGRRRSGCHLLLSCCAARCASPAPGLKSGVSDPPALRIGGTWALHRVTSGRAHACSCRDLFLFSFEQCQVSRSCSEASKVLVQCSWMEPGELRCLGLINPTAGHDCQAQVSPLHLFLEEYLFFSLFP